MGEIGTKGLDDTPVNGQTKKGITSNWAYDHAANKDAHHAVFVDRGDPSAYDFGVGSFTQNSQWNELDLHAIVPSGAIAVLLFIDGYGGSPTAYARFRKKGNANEINMSQVTQQVTATGVTADLIVPLPSDRIIEYKMYDNRWNAFNMAVKGWWI